MAPAARRSTVDLKPMTKGRALRERPVTIRHAAPDDVAALRRLAALGDTRAPSGQVLLAEFDGVPVAAISLHTGSVTADPFRHTADAVHLLRLLRRLLGLGPGAG
jgi:hypothetical protein